VKQIEVRRGHQVAPLPQADDVARVEQRQVKRLAVERHQPGRRLQVLEQRVEHRRFFGRIAQEILP